MVVVEEEEVVVVVEEVEEVEGEEGVGVGGARGAVAHRRAPWPRER